MAQGRRHLLTQYSIGYICLVDSTPHLGTSSTNPGTTLAYVMAYDIANKEKNPRIAGSSTTRPVGSTYCRHVVLEQVRIMTPRLIFALLLCALKEGDIGRPGGWPLRCASFVSGTRNALIC